MGYLSEGKTLTWDESCQYLKQIKLGGVQQFLDAYCDIITNHKNKSYPHRYGDEIEYTIYDMNHDTRQVSICLKASELMEKLNKKGNYEWHPEYASYMIEGLPKTPYDDTINDLLKIENDLANRRNDLKSVLSLNQTMATITSFPRLGCVGSSPMSNGSEPYSQSCIVSDNLIGNHMRFHTLTENIRKRRGCKVDIQVPVYQDLNTSKSIPNIIMDCMAFGMGCSCLQETIQVQNEREARYLYDQLAILAPLFLCITAASPAYCGYLSKKDCRWDIIASSVDDRTQKEMGFLKKSRYSSISVFIGNNDYMKKEYNDYDFVPDEDIDNLLGNKLDELLKKHINYLFIRDPLVIYEHDIITTPTSKLNLNKYENIHSTNWNTVRLKIPTSDKCGWRIEFRPMELQLDDFSNASFLIYVNLLCRAILKYQPNWYQRISLIDINMGRAQNMDAINKEKFHFKEMETSITQIFNNHINPIIFEYIKDMKLSEIHQKSLMKYINYIVDRVNCKNKTDASKIRQFVTEHPKYGKDSIVTDEICYDLMRLI